MDTIFKGIKRTFSVNENDQYNTISNFWDEILKTEDIENLIGIGFNWKNNNIDYMICKKNGLLKGSNTMIELPKNSWEKVSGKTDELQNIYEKIYKKGNLKLEIEIFHDNETCEIYYNRYHKPIKEIKI